MHFTGIMLLVFSEICYIMTLIINCHMMFTGDRKIGKAHDFPAEGAILTGVPERDGDCERMTLWRIPQRGGCRRCKALFCANLSGKRTEFKVHIMMNLCSSGAKLLSFALLFLCPT
jgi:hypothetical protein